MTPDYDFNKYTPLDFVYEKEDLLIDHGGKNAEYDFYRHAGVTAKGVKGEHINEERPVNVRSNMP